MLQERGEQRALSLCPLCRLIYYLPAEAVSKLIASVAQLAAPGSRLLFDFLRQDALDGTAHFPGYDNCATVRAAYQRVQCGTKQLVQCDTDGVLENFPRC